MRRRRYECCFRRKMSPEKKNENAGDASETKIIAGLKD
jgi:hypothetical protein